MTGRALVLGGTGFIGANVTRALRARGWRATVLTRGGGPAEALAGCDVDYVRGDLRDRAVLAAALDGADVLFHCAAPYPVSGRRGGEQARAARDGMRAVLDAAGAARLARVVYTSSYVTVGRPRSHDAAADESTALAPGEGGHPYFEMKRVMEEEALAAARSGLPLVALLPALCFGPYDARPTSGAALVALRRLRPAIHLTGRVTVIDVRDVADAHVAALDRGRIGERYLLGRETLTVARLTSLLAEAVGVRPPRWPVPTTLARAVARGLEALETLGLFRAPPFLTGTIAMLRHSVPLDCSKAARELGAPTRPVEQAIADEAAWLRAHGRLS